MVAMCQPDPGVPNCEMCRQTVAQECVVDVMPESLVPGVEVRSLETRHNVLRSARSGAVKIQFLVLPSYFFCSRRSLVRELFSISVGI